MKQEGFRFNLEKFNTHFTEGIELEHKHRKGEFHFVLATSHMHIK
jgi:hypothetical protein